MEILRAADLTGNNTGTAVYLVKNKGASPIPAAGEKPPTFDANDGYYFQPGEEKTLTEKEMLFLSSRLPSLEVTKANYNDGRGFVPYPDHSQPAGAPDFVTGTAEALTGWGGVAEEQQKKAAAEMAKELTEIKALRVDLKAELAATRELNESLKEKLEKARKPRRKKRAVSRTTEG